MARWGRDRSKDGPGWPEPHDAPWDFFPGEAGPFRVQQAGPLRWWSFDNVGDAFETFGDYCLPPAMCRNASVLGPTGEILLAYAWHPCGAVMWAGTAFGFELIGYHPQVEQVDAVFWELLAKGEVAPHEVAM